MSELKDTNRKLMTCDKNTVWLQVTCGDDNWNKQKEHMTQQESGTGLRANEIKI